MAKSKQEPSVTQPRESTQVKALRLALGLDDADWMAFLVQAKKGLANFERSRWTRSDEPLQIDEVPDEWFEDPYVLGLITIRVLKYGKARMADAMARHFLSTCEPNPPALSIPKGIGAAWLRLSRRQIETPLTAARLGQLALISAKDFFAGVAEDDLIPLCRLVLESKEGWDAWDLQVIVSLAHASDLHANAAYRVFDALLVSDRIPVEMKRELCRSLSMAKANDERLSTKEAELAQALRADFIKGIEVPLCAMRLTHDPLRRRIPALMRRAALALVDPLGEPPEEIVKEYFMPEDVFSTYAEPMTLGALDILYDHADRLDPKFTRDILKKAISKGMINVRKAAYRVGARYFGDEFLNLALEDVAPSARNWSQKTLADPRRTTRDE